MLDDRSDTHSDILVCCLQLANDCCVFVSADGEVLGLRRLMMGYLIVAFSF